MRFASECKLSCFLATRSSQYKIMAEKKEKFMEEFPTCTQPANAGQPQAGTVRVSGNCDFSIVLGLQDWFRLSIVFVFLNFVFMAVVI